MLLVLLGLCSLIFLAVLALLFRGPVGSAQESRTSEFLAAVPLQLTRMEGATDTRLATLDSHLRSELSGIRAELASEAGRARASADTASIALREEIARSIAHLGAVLNDGLADFRSDNKSSDDHLRRAVLAHIEALSQRISAFTSEQTQHHAQSREALHDRLTELGTTNTQHLERVRSTVEERLTRLNTDNALKLEEMRQTVDEKLHATLQSRLTESFGQVTTHLGEVQKGLGEMKELATGVGDLKKVLSNVKSRGIVGEFQLGLQLEQMFSPEQYVKNARIKPQTSESVEYALKFPNGPNSTVLLPIDAKFPKEDWERLEHAYEHGSAEEIASTGKAFERAIRAEGKRICEKYIDPPTTMPHGIMFLPTEALYAEVVRRPGLQSEIQQQCRVTIAGPSTFMAILTSFQMGFHTLAIERKGNEVWRVLSSAKKEFETFGDLMSSMEKQVGTVQNTIQKLGVRSRAIGRSLKDVSTIDSGAPSNLLSFDEIAGTAPFLAANATDE